MQGRVRGAVQQELTLHYPQNGWVEQNPEDIWRDTQFVCRGALRQNNIHPSQVMAIGITNQRETTVVWDRATGQPLYNAIVWRGGPAPGRDNSPSARLIVSCCGG